MTARVLIADDEDSLRWVLEKGLRQAGYDVVAVKDGDSALWIVGYECDRSFSQSMVQIPR